MLVDWKEDTEIIGILEGEVELDEEGMVQGRQDLLLSAYVLNLLLLDDVPLVQDLYYKYMRLKVTGKSHADHMQPQHHYT